MTNPWHMARVAQNRTTRNYKPIAPVGTTRIKLESDTTCRSCGHHVCSCPRSELYSLAKLAAAGIEPERYRDLLPVPEPEVFGVDDLLDSEQALKALMAEKTLRLAVACFGLVPVNDTRRWRGCKLNIADVQIEFNWDPKTEDWRPCKWSIVKEATNSRWAVVEPVSIPEPEVFGFEKATQYLEEGKEIELLRNDLYHGTVRFTCAKKVEWHIGDGLWVCSNGDTWHHRPKFSYRLPR